MDVWRTLGLKECWRIVTAMFLHANVRHIFNNMLILFFVGAMVEREVGHIRYAILFLLSGIGGNLLSLAVKILSYDTAASIGASGVVFGVDGVLLALVLFSGRRIENVTPARMLLMIAYSLYGGFTGHNIDNAAHVGGLLTGFVLGTLMCKTDLRKKKKI